MTITLCILTIRFLGSFCTSHNMRSASRHAAFAGWERTHQVHEEFVGIYTVPQNRRMDYHYGNDRCVLQVELTTQKVLNTMLQWICRQHMSGQRTGVAKLMEELEQRAV